MARKMFHLDFDDKKLRTGFVDIQKATEISTRNTLNIMAALTRKNAVKNSNDNFIQRNTFTKRNIRFNKTEAKKINRMFVRIGATTKADYMERQELGGTHKPKSGDKLAIAQRAARGGSHKRVVARQVYLRRIKKQSVSGPFKKNFQSKKARTVARAYVAQTKKKFFKHSENIYSINTFHKSNKAIRFTKTHLYNTSENSTKTKGDPWLMPATKKPIRDSQFIFNSQVNKLLRMKKII